jgi:hypothetical protein
MEGLMSKNTNEPPKRVDHKRNIKFPNPLCSRVARSISNKEKGEPPE